MRSGILLGDGGINRDNFGIIGLLERGTNHILMVDHVDDVKDRKKQTLSMHSLCNISTFLASRGFRVVFRGNPNSLDDNTPVDIASNCIDGEFTFHVPGRKPEHLNYWRWPNRLWFGEIIADQNMIKYPELSAVHGTKLYLLKSALDTEQCSKLPLCLRERSMASLPDGTEISPSIPNYLKNYWKDGATAPVGQTAEKGLFPQDSMGVMTYNSSPNLFTAYVELGNYRAAPFVSVIKSIRKELPTVSQSRGHIVEPSDKSSCDRLSHRVQPSSAQDRGS